MPHTSKNRTCSVISPLGEDVLHVRDLRGREAISEPFQFDLTLLSEDAGLAFDALIGSSLCIRMSLDGARERFIHGRVARFAQSVASERFATYHATLVPWLWLLKRSSNCRIFQHRTVPEIVAEVFRSLGCEEFELDLAGSYEPRDYVVQYRETDFNFVSRLLEDSGLSYYFRHDEKSHVLVLFDASGRARPCPGQPEAPLASGRDAEQSSGAVERWHFEREFRPGACALGDYSAAEPGLDLRVDARTRLAAGGNERFELYDYPGRYTTRAQGADLVQLRMQEEEAASQRIAGRSTCEAFTPGYRFDLRGHYRTSFDGPYLLTSVEHQLVQAEGAADGPRQVYENRFTCIEHALPWRTPRRTPRPRIQGVQTAIVVGEPGREIDVDEQGRVCVQFHWDRLGRRDAASSCRIRVSQQGGFFAPRVGQEVVVEFLEGDPDQPIITGRVYNGEQSPPWTDGAHGGIRTRSTPGGGEASGNEIRLEDRRGSELFFVQAERDQHILVKNDLSESVGNDESVSVGRNRTEQVGSDQTVRIGGSESVSIGGGQTAQVGLSQGISVGANQGLQVGGSQSTSVGRDQRVDVGASQSVQVAKDAALRVGRKYVIDAGDELHIKVGSAQIVMRRNGDIVIEGGRIQLKAAGDLSVKGRRIQQN